MSDNSATLPIIEKTYKVYKQLIILNSKLGKAHRYGLGVSAELANETKIFQLQADLEETGRMLGGWLKSVL
jgi:hypothetical protein